MSSVKKINVIFYAVMVISCAVINCTNRAVKGSAIIFHRFPLNNKELCWEWVVVTRREKVTPTKNNYLCGEHVTPADYKFADSIKLKDDAVPSLFKFPHHLIKNCERKEVTGKR